jgi:ABC-type thiamine transport system ATPase subunit
VEFRGHVRDVSQPRGAADTPAGVLSGGEQQMLTMCRTLMGDPDLIMIDEPTEGLAPLIVEQVVGVPTAACWWSPCTTGACCDATAGGCAKSPT